MEGPEINVVTGAFSYTGKYITQRLLALGKEVRTLTGHPERAYLFDYKVTPFPFNFENPSELARSLEGATTLYNTYWIRLPRGKATFERAVENTKTLLRAAEAAGIRRVVHISITNASEDSPLPYFRGKGQVEKAIRQSKLTYAIIRPTVIFGLEGILINNIAWLLRRFPVFVVFGRGDYLVQPVYVEDVADLAVTMGQGEENITVDAAGPEVFTFESMVRLIAEKIGSRAKLIHISPEVGLLLTKLIGYLVRDVVITRDEVRGLMSNLLISRERPTGSTLLSQWLEQHAGAIGIRYASELKQHYR